MAYCGPRGIPRSVFLGRAAHPGEPQWLDEDIDAALAWHELDTAVCKRCGTEPDEFDAKQGGHPFAYVATRRLDPGCELLDQEQASLREDMKNNDRAGFGVQIVLERNPTPDSVFEDN